MGSKSRVDTTEAHATVLRLAAINFVRHISDPVSDDHDRAGRARDQALLKAAVAYTRSLDRK